MRKTKRENEYTVFSLKSLKDKHSIILQLKQQTVFKRNVKSVF